MRRAPVFFALLCVSACAAQSGQSPPAASPSMMSPAGAGAMDAAPTIAGAKEQLRAAEIELTSALGQCGSACRALASMERATKHLCDLAASPEDQRACEEARQKLTSSRERVRTECGECK